MNTDKIEAIKTAREIIAKNPVFLDTETTGLDRSAEIVNIAVIDHDGTELMNTLVRPTLPIPERTTAIHGIRNEDVADAPTFADIQLNIGSLLYDRLVVIYNKNFDLRLMKQSAKANLEFPLTRCAMELYAQFYGDWNEYHKSYRWQKQAAAAKQLGIEMPANLHRAAADANLCRLIIEAMAATPLPGEARPSQLFIETFNSMADRIHNWAKRKGFWQAGEDRNDGEMIALMHSELSEALEAIRHGNPPDDKIPEFNGYEVELADCVIRIMDVAIARNLRVAEAIVAKMAFNEGRPYKHGKEF
ncbi:hypothetical protein LCGC14_2059140 [marine sediment metagenome]|uniref:Exonuclease domain-containing protein n=1 Tax=marine sediment metagenome TaxID=412755 RepID=A0A0F9H072_9ZZZZ